ncbi:unnamed protein product [Linum trigynum]|uniref:Gnk2-homologous domain-containing protein n=1 Tax=Linum trigynum TaxID=586398 RepID=A0AAV2E2E6_9ROSI
MAPSTAFLVRRLLVIISFTAIFFATGFVVSYPDKKDRVCIHGPESHFDYAWNETRLAGTNVQVEVLKSMEDRLDDVSQGFVDVCTGGTFDGSGDGHDQYGTDIFVFVGCRFGMQDEDCRNCVGNATETVRANCPDAVGAQAATGHCCVRYETYPFCFE